MFKTLEELEKLNTERLLNLYKKERSRFYASGYWCTCGCGGLLWDIYDKDKEMEDQYITHVEYLDAMKRILNTREHINIKEKTK